MSLTLSAPHCFDEAVKLDDLDAFRNISESVGNISAKKMFDNCGTLQNAVYLNRTAMVSEMLTAKQPGADPDGGRGQVEILKIASVKTVGLMKDDALSCQLGQTFRNDIRALGQPHIPAVCNQPLPVVPRLTKSKWGF